MAENEDKLSAKDFKFSWDGGAAALAFLCLTTYAGVKLGIEIIRSNAQIKVAEINNGFSGES